MHNLFCVVQDAQAACAAYDLAVQKLQDSVQFARGDVAPHNAIGGYQAALHINASCAEALLGVGETHNRMAKLCQRNEPQSAQAHYETGAAAYERALQLPTQLGSFQDRCEARYNYACLLALSKQLQEAMHILSQLLSCQGVTIQEISNDTDFTEIRMLPAFQHLIEQAQVTSQASPS